MKILCLFMACRWVHELNVIEHRLPKNYSNFGPDDVITYQIPKEEKFLTGVYQCSRCKSISRGAPR